MSEITKLYENAGIDYEERYNNCTLNKEGECKLKCSCDICKYSEEKYIYPPFTAEKQIYLIKWLSDKDDYIGIHYDKYKGSFNIQTNSSGLCVCNEFEQALASMVNFLWQDLSPEEKQQVKGILE